MFIPLNYVTCIKARWTIAFKKRSVSERKFPVISRMVAEENCRGHYSAESLTLKLSLKVSILGLAETLKDPVLPSCIVLPINIVPSYMCNAQFGANWLETVDLHTTQRRSNSKHKLCLQFSHDCH